MIDEENHHMIVHGWSPTTGWLAEGVTPPALTLAIVVVTALALVLGRVVEASWVNCREDLLHLYITTLPCASSPSANPSKSVVVVLVLELGRAVARERAFPPLLRAWYHCSGA